MNLFMPIKALRKNKPSLFQYALAIALLLPLTVGSSACGTDEGEEALLQQSISACGSVITDGFNTTFEPGKPSTIVLTYVDSGGERCPGAPLRPPTALYETRNGPSADFTIGAITRTTRNTATFQVTCVRPTDGNLKSQWGTAYGHAPLHCRTPSPF